MRALVLLALSGCTLIVGEADPRDQIDLSVTSCDDTGRDPRNCGGCGHDCTKLPGVDPTLVGCVLGACDLRNACLTGRADCSGGELDGCETDLSTANHCGSCSIICGGQVPLCAMNAVGGGWSCADSCPFNAPTQCATSCVDVTNDPNHCGNCVTVCPATTGHMAVCLNGHCSTACGPGFHACGTACADDGSIQSCGQSCTPCPAAPANAVAICDPFFGCDFQCNSGFARSGNGCVPNMSFDMRLPTGDLAIGDLDTRPLCDCSGLAMACVLGCVGHNCCSECTPESPLPLLCTGGVTCATDPTCQLSF